MPVKFEALTLESLGTFDERIPLLFRKHIVHISQDCANRPADPSPRELVIKISAIPEQNDDGTCESGQLSVTMTSSVPKFKTKPLPVLVTNQGFKFNAEIPEELDQPALPGTVEE